MTNRLIGSELVNKPVVKRWSLEQGWTTTKKHIGTPDEIRDLIQRYQNAFTTITKLEEGDPLWTLEVEHAVTNTGGGGPTPDDSMRQSRSFELNFNRMTQPLNTHPHYIDGVSDDTRRVIYTWDKLFDKGELPLPTLASAKEAAQVDTGVDEEKVEDYISQRLLGIDSYDSYLPVVTITTYLGREASARASLDRCGMAVDPSDMDLPNDSVIAKFVMPTPQDDSSEQFVWIKGWPRITRNGNRYSIQQDYSAYRKASKLLYGENANLEP